MYIDPGKREALTGLFANHRRQRVLIDAVLGHLFGTAVAGSETEPEVAMLRIGFCTLLGGNPEHPVAYELIKDLSRTSIISDTEAWCNTVLEVHGDSVVRPDRCGFGL